MKKILYPMILLALAASPACKSKKMAKAQASADSTSSTVTQSTVINVASPDPDVVTTPVDTSGPGGEALGTDNNCRVVFSFISKGAGIDSKSAEVFEKFMTEYRPAVQFEKIHWGREGEIDYCLKLNELSTKDADKFVKDARIQLADKPLVLVEENAPCVHKR